MLKVYQLLLCVASLLLWLFFFTARIGIPLSLLSVLLTELQNRGFYFLKFELFYTLLQNFVFLLYHLRSFRLCFRSYQLML